MVKISQDGLTLILFEVSLRIPDHKTLYKLSKQASSISNDYHTFLGVGQVDFLLMIQGPPRFHPLIQLPNIRLVNVLRCLAISGTSKYDSKVRKNAPVIISCVKINPKVTAEWGFASLSKIFLPEIQLIKKKFSSSNINIDIYITLGWTDIVLIVTADNFTSALAACSEIRNMRFTKDSTSRFFASTSFSTLFLKAMSDNKCVLIEGEVPSTEYDFLVKIYCKPGGDHVIADDLEEHSPFFFLGKKDVGLVLKSYSLSQCVNFLIKLREKYQKTIYATKTDIMINKTIIQSKICME